MPYYITVLTLDFSGSGLSEGVRLTSVFGLHMVDIIFAPSLAPNNTYRVTFHSQGYVSLGHFEKDDLKTVVNHLRNSGKTSRIGLWGRYSLPVS